MADERDRQTTNIYDRYELHTTAEKFYLEPQDQDGGPQSHSHMQIDRITGEMRLANSVDEPILAQTEKRTIYGIVGIVRLVAGPYLLVITKSRLVGHINGHAIWQIERTDAIPYSRTTLHLTEKQVWYNRHFLEMIQLVLATEGFYYSTTYDLTHTLQRLENTTPEFRHMPMHERADERFVWNRHVCAEISMQPELYRYALPIIHGFVGIRRCHLGQHSFQLTIISRRSVYRAGTRFYMRGVNLEGHSANFIETEQIVEYDRPGGVPPAPQHERFLTAFVQTRGSIPLLWSQRPNLRWQPVPMMRPTDDQLAAFVRHMNSQRLAYNGTHVIVSLINQKGREKSIGSELARVVLQASLEGVKYVPFDFHKECRALNWDRLSVLKEQLRPDLLLFGFFGSRVSRSDEGRIQTGFFRTNCMDCLDRTNVVQSLLAKESLGEQLRWLGLIGPNDSLDQFSDFSSVFKHLWADNGDECSKQYAGTGALKADFTRLGRRTYSGAVWDGVNAITRYFRNNFFDGYRQDAIDLFLGNFRVDVDNLPSTLEATIMSLDWHGGVLLCAIVAGAMTLLCVLVAVENAATYALFWMVVFVVLLAVIVLNGEEFVNLPKLKID
uniref:Phosphatidylinositol-3-phosphatase SAC1 n=1 Tax=Plectus sambesii TaxID=2011161 RepID=A0A914VT28_9BILA